MGKELVIIHYHLRPGGVRRVIELGVAKLLSKLNCDSVTLAAGEYPPDNWLEIFKSKINGRNLRLFIRPSFCYLSEQNCSGDDLHEIISKDVGELFRCLKGEDAVLWFHNPAVGRNVILTDRIFRKSAETGIPLVAHHHDWWFENRWQRLDEMFQCGFDSLEKIAAVFFNTSPNIKHCAINYFDYSILNKYFKNNSAWLPNPIESGYSASRSDIESAKNWLNEVLNDSSPVWIMPCRVLRRKNIAEALLIKEWINPSSWLVTTAGASSSGETSYAEAVQTFAKEKQIKFRLGIITNNHHNAPDVYSIIAASEVVLLTSLQEGFGLTYIEAAIMKVPLIARMLPNLEGDFEKFGLRFPYKYRDILIHPDLFSWKDEAERQRKIFESWLEKLPCQFREWVKLPEIARDSGPPSPTPFSKLTLQGQLEVLAHEPSYSFEKCVALNPFIAKLKKKLHTGRLKAVELSQSTLELLSLENYAENFIRLLKTVHQPLTDESISVQIQNEFIRKKLASEFIYPQLIEQPVEQ